MKNYSFTTRNVTAGERSAAGDMVLRHLGDVTLTLEGMTRAEVTEWEWATDALNTRGLAEDVYRLTVNGWRVVHPEAGVVGLLFQGAGSRVHVEWYDAVNGDFFSAGWVRNLRHGAAAIVNARQHVGQGLPVDVEPEPYKAPEPVRPVWLKDDTLVRYHGSLAQLSGGIFRASECARFDECDNWDCEGYALLPVGSWRPCAVHVGRGSVTALDTEAAAA
ncbi:hypothetical protein [Streptomyces scabiei]|uniref:hypothetical protein n=1 Tax=Streptomyces scabiei TaxID=1930 RepID=UPI001B3424EB|nr:MULTISPECIES: hypothetical protein [Streptomyces]MBP5896343.1 hypothetical protein [Streptomyces sp. LBUM 1481]MDX3298639.1 hypothetical protein [Streptomyces scabiei]